MKQERIQKQIPRKTRQEIELERVRSKQTQRLQRRGTDDVKHKGDEIEEELDKLDEVIDEALKEEEKD